MNTDINRGRETILISFAQLAARKAASIFSLIFLIAVGMGLAVALMVLFWLIIVVVSTIYKIRTGNRNV